MRTLINYAVIYSLGHFCLSKEVFDKFEDGCGTFGTFCREQSSYSSHFKLDIL